MARSLVSKQCLQCGKTFERERHKIEKAKFCSNECKWAADTRNPVRQCLGCGQDFKPKRAGQQTCSIACRNSAGLQARTRKVRATAGQRRSEWVTEHCVVCNKAVERRKSAVRQFVYCSRECYAAAPPRSGKGRPPVPEGTRRVVDGYVRVKLGSRWRPEHRVVMEQILDRRLTRGENVHHINGVKTDNRPENLQLWLESQPKGAAVQDLLSWAREIIARYEDIDDSVK